MLVSLSYYDLFLLKARTVNRLLKMQEEALDLPNNVKSDVAASFQQVAFHHVSNRTNRAIKWCQENLEEKLSSLVWKICIRLITKGCIRRRC